MPHILLDEVTVLVKFKIDFYTSPKNISGKR